jgi:Malectin domain/Fibronectin type III domain
MVTYVESKKITIQKKMLRAFFAASLVLLALSIGEAARAQSSVTVTLTPSNPGAAIPDDYIGLSYETNSINGGNYFFPTNQPLLQVFNSLGIKSLRFGGNSADNGTLPSNADLDTMFGFAQAAGIPVIYTLRLQTFNPSAAAATAGPLWAKYSSSITCFSIGSQPDLYAISFATFTSEASSYMSSVGAVAPGAKFCAPDVSRHNPGWTAQAANQFGPSKLVLVTSHPYPGGSGGSTSGAAARDILLGTGIFSEYMSQYNASVPTAFNDGLSLRLTETNSFVLGGAPDASNTFASALWGLDYMYWWTAQPDMIRGMNFHTGDNVSAGPPNYAVFLTTTGGYSMHPLGYGIKAFDLGGHGRVVQVAINNPANVDLTAYGVLASDNSLWVTVINKSHDASATTVDLTIQPGGSYNQASEWVLQAPNNDVSQTTGITLGGAEFNTDGTWNGTSTPVAISGGNVNLTMPPATAFVVQLQPGVSTCSAAPSAPGALSATAASSSQINLNWMASTAGSGCSITYNVFRSTASGFTPSSGNQIASGVTATSFSDSGLAASTTYFYLVEGVDSAGSSAASNQASATTQASSCGAAPTAPSGLGATATSSSQISLSWTASTAGTNCSITYSVFRSTTNGFTAGSGNQIATGLTATSFSDTGLTASTTYYYLVEGVDSVGASAASNQASATTQSGGGSGTQLIAINAGGPAESPFVADEDFTGGATIDHANTINTSNVTNPAPAAVYQSGRDTTAVGPGTTFSYTIGGFTAGTDYLVRLHFCETFFTAAGKRTFNVSINGTQVLTDFDIFATAGGENIANIQQFTEAANASGQFVILFTSEVNNALISGIEVDSTTPPPPTCTSICINSGGPAVSPFVADEDFTGGTTIDHANTINTSKVTNPAPAAVYQSGRDTTAVGPGTTFSYTIGGFTANSSHTVRLHFCETFFTAAGKRTFNVSINGTQVLTDFDIFATAGGENIANIQQFTETANVSGQYVIVFTSEVNNALISGIEID